LNGFFISMSGLPGRQLMQSFAIGRPSGLNQIGQSMPLHAATLPFDSATSPSQGQTGCRAESNKKAQPLSGCAFVFARFRLCRTVERTLDYT